MKRGKIALGSPLVARFSMAGADVDTDPISKMLLHESMFLSQIVQAGSVPNPGSGAGYVGTVAYPTWLTDPMPLIYPHYGGMVAYPAPYAYLTGLPGYIPVNVLWSATAGVLSIYFGGPTVTSADYCLLRMDTPS